MQAGKQMEGGPVVFKLDAICFFFFFHYFCSCSHTGDAPFHPTIGIRIKWSSFFFEIIKGSS